MQEDTSTPRSIVPHLIAGTLVILGLVVAYVWLAQEEAQVPEPAPVVSGIPEPDSQPTPEVSEPIPEQPQVEPEPLPELPESTMPEEPEPEPEPLDTSDGAVKTALASLADYEQAASLLVNQGLLQRFVVTAMNLAQGEEVPNHQVLAPPSQSFRVYQQAGKEWIDASSYKRYTPYVDVLDAMETESLITLYQQYKPAIREIYAEIGDPDENFDYVIIDVINHLLDTPEVPVPVEVYTDSVMYKFRDERLEALSGPQKHLLRTGPENMRRIKAKLREVKQALQ